MGNTWIEKWWSAFVKNRQKRQKEKQLKAALIDQIEKIARDYDAGFRLVSGYSKKLIGPARNALAYIENKLSLISGPVVLDPEQWSTDGYLNALFVDADAIRDLVRMNKNLQSFFESENTSQAAAMMTADWKQKTVLGTETHGDIVQRDVSQSFFYFENHRIMEVCLSLDESRDRVCRRILGELIIKTIEGIQSLQEWNSDIEKERELLEFFIHSSNQSETATGGSNNEMRMNGAKQVLAELDSKEQELRRQIGDAESQLKKVTAVLMDPQTKFSVEPISLRLNRLGFQVKEDSDESVHDITLAKCTLEDQPLKVIVWVRVNR
jgi:hypothetical protein